MILTILQYMCIRDVSAIFISGGVYFTGTRRGGRVLQVGPHRYYRHRARGEKEYWVCKFRPYGCRATITTFEDQIICCKPKFVESMKGKRILVIGNYRHCVHKVLGLKTHWTCSTHRRYSCRAVVHTAEDWVVAMKKNHNH
ncbi:hypothetical protein EVAR_17899_1 [Eumeta japonica]|uniref:FLYWCH-type domain-containing protein n=1 Tax=Eumeta variegata TaxID=151549 RepID=A0A4C1UYT6_EUMVA|nr:hypothetical protein EVAR_17899_1 [Eumeta japonica]